MVKATKLMQAIAFVGHLLCVTPCLSGTKEEGGAERACISTYCGAVPRIVGQASTPASGGKSPEQSAARIMVVTFNTGNVAHFSMTQDTAGGMIAAAEGHNVSMLVVALQNAALDSQERLRYVHRIIYMLCCFAT